MSAEASGEVPVTFAKGVLDDVGELTATSADDDQAHRDEAEALKRRIAELLVECKGTRSSASRWGQDSILSWQTAGGFASTFPPTMASLGSA